jgi:hypothetical protein
MDEKMWMLENSLLVALREPHLRMRLGMNLIEMALWYFEKTDMD